MEYGNSFVKRWNKHKKLDACRFANKEETHNAGKNK
jgi:hypothetical protein